MIVFKTTVSKILFLYLKKGDGVSMRKVKFLISKTNYIYSDRLKKITKTSNMRSLKFLSFLTLLNQSLGPNKV